MEPLTEDNKTDIEIQEQKPEYSMTMSTSEDLTSKDLGDKGVDSVNQKTQASKVDINTEDLNMRQGG